MLFESLSMMLIDRKLLADEDVIDTFSRYQ